MLNLSVCYLSSQDSHCLTRSTLPGLLHRNRDRPAKVPEKVLYRMKNRLEMRDITEVQVVDWVLFNERIQQRFSVITI
ncbi:hypothetical protein [Fischerella thermalis]|uniref:hypothetical protein n=1 Tax=Fischerella thermalis TaxID=372787 RepID=UPI0011AEDE3F|nr:hypothetical protein [Fischerella thermalis]